MMLKCTECGTYGLSEECTCGGKRVNPKPPRYSPQDHYGEYRREYKKREGLI